jgi:hypothetical protein
LYDAVPNTVIDSWKAELGLTRAETLPTPGSPDPRKSYTAHTANQILGRSGDFWFREYHDRFIRDDRHFRNTVNYIERNPVKAGLVDRPEKWRWSSAWWQRGEKNAGGK